MPVIIESTHTEVKAKVFGELDHHNAVDIRKNIDESIEKIRPKLLIIDFSNLTFMDSSGVGLIMGRYKTMKLFDGEIEIHNPPQGVEKILKLSGIEKLAKIIKTKEE